jgi:hypothetical protein
VRDTDASDAEHCRARSAQGGGVRLANGFDNNRFCGFIDVSHKVIAAFLAGFYGIFNGLSIHWMAPPTSLNVCHTSLFPSPYALKAVLKSGSVLLRFERETGGDDSTVEIASVAAAQTVAVQPGEDQDIQWVIDPLDGTTNFVKRLPHFSVSIAVRIKGL